MGEQPTVTIIDPGLPVRPPDRDRSSSPTGRPRRRRSALLAAAALPALLAVAACSDDEDDSADATCFDVEAVSTAYEDLILVETDDEGVEAVTVSVEELQSTITQLTENLDDVLEPSVAQLESDVDDLAGRLESLSDDASDSDLEQISSDVSDLGSSVDEIVSTANDDLDCDLATDS